MKQQHEFVEADLAFFSPGITSASFALSAWGSSDHDTPAQAYGRPSFPECLDSPSWDEGDTDADEGDDQSESLSVSSCENSGKCEKMDYDYNIILTEIDECLSWDPLSQPRDEVDNLLSTRKVHFCPEVVSNVCYFERAASEDHKNMYYTAHELQRMIDDFVAQGGSSLLG